MVEDHWANTGSTPGCATPWKKGSEPALRVRRAVRHPRTASGQHQQGPSINDKAPGHYVPLGVCPSCIGTCSLCRGFEYVYFGAPGRIRTCDARFRKSCDCGLFRFYQVLQLRTGCTTGLHGHLWSTVRTTIRTTVPLAPPPCRGPRRAGASGACGPPALRLSRSAGVSPPFAALLTHPWASERVVWATRRSLPTFPAVTAGNDHGRGTTCAVGGYGLVCSGSRGPRSSGSRSMRVRACWWPMFDLGGDSVGAAGCAGGVVRVMTPGRVGGGGGRWIWARSRRARPGLARVR